MGMPSPKNWIDIKILFRVDRFGRVFVDPSTVAVLVPFRGI
jgi:hypothetical protein